MSDHADWRTRAACRDRDPEWWFPGRGDNGTRKLAVSICRECPVARQCAEYALRVDAVDGIWGGLTQNQRSVIMGTRAAQRRSRLVMELHTLNLAPCGTPAAYRRHQRRGETPCWQCVEAERHRNRNRSGKATG